jgi:hypothetical protein
MRARHLWPRRTSRTQPGRCVAPEEREAVRIARGERRGGSPEGEGDRAQSAREGEQSCTRGEGGKRGGEVSDAGLHPVGGGEHRDQQRRRGSRGFAGPAGPPCREPRRIHGAGERRQSGEGDVRIGEEPRLACEVAEPGERGRGMPLGQEPDGRIDILLVVPGGVGQLGSADQVGGADREVARTPSSRGWRASPAASRNARRAIRPSRAGCRSHLTSSVDRLAVQ